MDPVVLGVVKDPTTAKVLIVSVILAVGWLIARLVTRSVVGVASRHFDVHQTMLIRRITFYVLMAVSTMTALNEAGINLSVVVGAAGVASVAVGFAAQTSMSNLISGIFIVIEKPFMVGDTIKVGGTSGEVAFMGLLSTSLKTVENVMVRVPNEVLMKSEISNITRFPVRRLDLLLSFDYNADLNQVRKVLLDVANQHESVLKTPPPSVAFKSFAENAVQVVYSVWMRAEKLAEMSFDIPVSVQKTLAQSKIYMAHGTLVPPTRNRPDGSV